MTTCALNQNASLREAVEVIENTRKTIAVILDDQQKVLGTISDGDIRRALLAGHSLNNNVEVALNKNPVTAKNNFSNEYYLKLIHQYNLEAIPIVDENQKYQCTIHIDNIKTDYSEDALGFGAAVIMAGGEGKRLRPITNSIPKPMVLIDNVPLIELQIRRLVKAGIKKIFVSINYLSHIIEEHLSDGSQFGASISYLKEEKKLGTAGALSLIEDPPEDPLLVLNGDIFTKVSYGNILKFHNDLKTMMTATAVEYHINIPYGVIRSNGSVITALEEKPSQKFLCNAGIYVLSREALRKIPYNEYFDITELIEKLIRIKNGVNVFPVYEYWADIGSPMDLEKLQNKVRDEKKA